MKVRLKVYLDGMRDTSHPLDKDYDHDHLAVAAALVAIAEPAVSEVALVKLNDQGQEHTPIVGER